MTSEEIIAELRACLALQNEIADKQLELATRYKAVLKSERAKGHNQAIVVRIDGEIYSLIRLDMLTDEMREVMRIARKLKGFYGGYRLIKSGKILESQEPR
jgi:hypothetical protein